MNVLETLLLLLSMKISPTYLNYMYIFLTKIKVVKIEIITCKLH